jgi:gliding motility-associated-like protein
MKKKILFIMFFAVFLIQTVFSQVFTPVKPNTLAEGSVVINKLYNSTGANGVDDVVEILVVQDHSDLRSLYIKDFQANKNGGAIGYFFKEVAFWSDVRSGTVIVLRNNTTSSDVTANPQTNDFNLDIGLLDQNYILPGNASTTIFFDINGDNMVSLQKSISGTTSPISILGGGPQLGLSFGASVYFRLNDPIIAGPGTFTYAVNPTSTITDYRHAGTSSGTYVYDANKTKSNVTLNDDPTPIALKLGEPNNITNATYINSLRDVIAAPTITSFTPTTEKTGNTVTITGTNFTGTTTVKFGGVDAISFIVNSDTEIKAVVGVGASGDVSVTNARTTGKLAGFTYIPSLVPTITSFSPTSAAPGDLVTINGTNLNIGTSSVKFGGVEALSFLVISATKIEAIVNQNTLSGSVSVTTFGGTANLSGFTAIGAPVPTITSFTPTNAGENATVTITGTGFNTTNKVTFGGKAAVSFNKVSATVVTAVVSKGFSGDIVLTTLGGDATKAGFTYTGPLLTSFTPQAAGAGTTVTITGTGFTNATAVSFGNVAVASFQVVSATSITAVVGAGASGNVTVTTPLGSITLAGFTFIPAPIISSFSPLSTGKGNSVIINGQNFTNATSVTFGGTGATSFVVNSATKITAIVGTGASGGVGVVTPGGSASLAGFTFIQPPTVTAFTPTSSIAGETVTITGTNFTSTTSVKFGGSEAASFTIESATTITAKLPIDALSGKVSVTTLGGEASLDGFTFILPPIIKSIISNYASEGSSVKITGLNFDNASDVRFGGVRAKSFTIISSTVIVAVVGEGGSGSVSVTTIGGTAIIPGFTFIQGRGSLLVHNVLTPNGDGKNDTWIIENLSLYPINRVKIFNEAGKQVYTKDYYDNEWDGTYNGEPLPAGNYMYVIILSNNLPSQKGYITLIR